MRETRSGLYFYRVPSPPATDDGSARPLAEDPSTYPASVDAVRKADGDNGASETGLVPAATEADGALPFEARAAVLASLADTQPIPVVTDMEPHAVPGITPPDTGPGVNEAGTRAGAEAGEGPPRAADAGPADLTEELISWGVLDSDARGAMEGF